MTRDELLALTLVLSFAAFFTVHVSLVASLARRVGPAHAAVAFIIPPLAPWWGSTRGLHARVVLWWLSAGAYALIRLLAWT